MVTLMPRPERVRAWTKNTFNPDVEMRTPKPVNSVSQ
jgi:hypothetical protein